VGQDGFSLGDVGTVAANDSIVLICFPICKGNLKTMMRSALIIFVSLLFIHIHHGSSFVSYSKPTFLTATLSPRTKLYSGVGIATNYSWTEEPFELEIHVNIPEGTRAKEIRFQALPRSVDLRLGQEDGTEVVLLDPK
jgi:hypothetical protein